MNDKTLKGLSLIGLLAICLGVIPLIALFYAMEYDEHYAQQLMERMPTLFTYLMLCLILFKLPAIVERLKVMPPFLACSAVVIAALPTVATTILWVLYGDVIHESWNLPLVFVLYYAHVVVARIIAHFVRKRLWPSLGFCATAFFVYIFYIGSIMALFEYRRGISTALFLILNPFFIMMIQKYKNNPELRYRQTSTASIA